jgi:hypothetical protein
MDDLEKMIIGFKYRVQPTHVHEELAAMGWVHLGE